MNTIRRIDRKTSDEDAMRVLSESLYGTLATINEDGSPYCVSFSMNGAGSNSSMLKTPHPFHVPVATIIAPIIAGTPVV